MTLNIKNIIKKNIRFISAMIVVIILGIFGISYALKVAPFNKIAVNIKSSNMDVNISYDSGVNGADISNSGNLLPINDSLVTGPTVNDSRVLKAKFYVTGNTSNPENSIYDVAIHDFNVDCELRTEDLKWRLYKNGTLLSSGNLSPKFDTMSNNRLVLTETQQDLTTTKDEYVFLLWISESCSGDIANCSKEQDQSKYLGKSLSGSIKLELATKSKKALVRTTGVSGSCNYTMTSTPTCNTLTYNGNEQTLVSAGDNYTISNGTGTNAGDYAVTLKLKDGYKWNDGSTNDKILNCSINRKNAVITANNQTIKYGSSIDNSKYSVSNLISGHSVSSVYLDTNIDKVGTGVITPTKSKIVDTSGNDVTDNYDLNYISGTLTINCLNTAVPPTAGNKRYNGSEQVGVSGGSNIDLTGTLKATAIGNYNASAVPKANYCWNDGTTTKRDYVWSIKSNTMYITLNNKEADYTGSAINIDAPVIKNSDGDIITGPTLTYAYYNGGSCSGTALSGAPSNAGSYSVRVTANAYGEYARSDSNCATLVINKVDSTLNASIPESITYGRTATLTYILNPTGNVTCSSSNANVATCSVDTTNKKITITPVNVGNTQITINGIPSNSNYNSSSVSKNVIINCSNTATEPSVVSGLIYNGSSQTGLKGGSNVNLSTISAINAGNYTGKATPKTNYCWTDGTTTTKSYSWSIAKKDVRCSITSVPTLKYPSSATGSIKYSCTDSKVPSVTSSSTSDITVSGVTSTSATLKALKVGSSIITVSTASDTNYNASNKATSNISTSASAYTVTYNNNGGSGCSTTSVTYGGKYGTMCEPTRNGYVFIGWFDENYKDKPLNYYADTYSDLKKAFRYDADALYNHYITYGKGEGRRISQYVKGDSFTGNANKTIYAGWYAQGYTISYNSNGGTGSMASDVVKTGGTATIKANEFTKKGYTFAGWTTKSDGTDDGYNWTGWSGTWNYVDGQYGIANKTLKLYARWTPKSYTISYNSNGGSGTMTSDTVSTGGSVTIKSNTFKRTGYKFVGWTTKSDGTDDGHGWTGWSGTWNYDNGQYGIANDKLVLYARWDNHFTVTYNDNGGSGCSSSSKTVTYGSTYGDLCTPTRSGYIFAGWYSSNYANAPWTYYYDKYKNDSTVASIGRNDKVGLYNNYLTNSTRKFSRYTSSDTYSVNGNQTLVAGWLKFNYKREDAKYCSDGYFDTIGDAYNGCYGSTITILNDVTESSAYTFKNYASAIIGYSVTINLNSHTLTIPSLVFDSLSGEAYIFGPGKITYNSSQTNISDNSALIHVKNGILYINGGSYISNDLNSAIRAESGAKLNLSDTNSRLVIEASVINSAYTACTTGIASYDTEEFIIQAKSNGMYIYACQGIEYPGVLRVMTSYPNGNNRGVEMSVIANRGYAILKRTGNVQVGSDTCDTRDSCTAAEIAKGRLGHYGYGTEMYPYLASYSATTNDELFSVIYNNSDVVIWYTGGRLVSTKTGLSCANGGIYSSGDACYKYFSTYPIRKSNAYTGIKYSTVSNEKNSHGDNINGFKVMLYE
ncbi:MAG: InlB B-repeat-containing protein [Bacilli bacterium]|nr:InlB B-repeat-containing protein [Bacilli bacterium]